MRKYLRYLLSRHTSTVQAAAPYFKRMSVINTSEIPLIERELFARIDRQIAKLTNTLPEYNEIDRQFVKGRIHELEQLKTENYFVY